MRRVIFADYVRQSWLREPHEQIIGAHVKCPPIYSRWLMAIADAPQWLGVRTSDWIQHVETGLKPELVDRLMSFAEQVFGNEEKAKSWMRTPNSALDRRTPLSLLKTDAGSTAVERVIGRIAHGVYS